MPRHDTGVTELLRRASDGLPPDVDRIVSGGITRGRARRRRARTGTTLASLAVVGVVGVLVSVVPRPDGADRARDPGIASDGGGMEATETPTVEPPAPATTERALSDFDAGQVHAIVDGILGTDLGAEPRPSDTIVDDPDEKVAYFPHAGMETGVGMRLNQLPTLARCTEMNARLGGSCTELPDGTVQLTWGPTLADGVTCQGVSAYHYGNEVWASSCNAAAGKNSTPRAPQPPLSLGQLAAIANSDVWFA